MTAPPTIAQALQDANRFLRENDVPEGQLVAQSLLAVALDCDRTYLIVNFKQNLTPEQDDRFQQLLARRADGEPLQYITGSQEFFGLEFEVTSDVLIPRPESELIVEEVIRLSAGIEAPLIVDVGTGSGCLAVALARELPSARLIASDISPAALEVARRNALRHCVADRICFLEGDLLDPMDESLEADFVISNPPYIAMEEVASLQREVRDWEPHLALTDFGDGLEFFRRLLADAPQRLKRGGHLLCEMGYTQAEAVTALVDEATWTQPHIIPDLQGIPRCLILEKR